MKGFLKTESQKIIWQFDDEILWIEAYGANSIRVRSTKLAQMPDADWALLTPKEVSAVIKEDETGITLINGEIKGHLSTTGKLAFYDKNNNLLLKEQWKDRQDEDNRMSHIIQGRLLKPVIAGKYSAEVIFEPKENEQIFGMGQYQMPYQDLMGCELELAQRNSQVSIPFYQSNLGYGFLWNNPAIGRAMFAKNHTKFYAQSTEIIDYWITAGSTPAQINKQFTDVVGKASKFPSYALGLWQSKLRYETQEQLLTVAREYHKRNIPISVIVCDFFHWPNQGDWKFDEKFWPNPKAMVDELKSMGMELMVSVWTTVDPRSDNYAEMKSKGYLVRTDRGVRTQMICLGADVFYDATNPDARKYLFSKIKENYLKHGIKLFWLDVAEPEYTTYDFDNYRYYSGSCLETGNIYPMCYAKGFYDGLTSEGVDAPITLVRSAWFGSQRQGAILWSGDIHSRFEVLRMQFAAGLNVALCGIPWWTTDIGGFYGGDPKGDYFRELIVRWFQFGVFCPVFRLHGWRLPTGEGDEKMDSGLFDFETCGDNEIWSFGEDAYKIIYNLVMLRERIKPYIRKQFDKASTEGTPIMRPLFYDFPNDETTWKTEHQFMFGPDLMVAPVLYEKMYKRSVYLPRDAVWTETATKKEYEGGCKITVDAQINCVPLFVKKGSDLLDLMGDYGSNN